jgi:hypothetical protein
MLRVNDGLQMAGKQNPRLGEIRSKRTIDRRKFYLTERGLYILSAVLLAALIFS